MTSNSGLPVRIARPLDFLVISDHAENLGLAPMIAESNPALLANDWGRAVRDLVKAGKNYEAAIKVGREAMLPRVDPISDPAMNRGIWESQTAAADKFNDPGYFTALIGYEWTSTPDGNNLHRVVIYKDDASKANQVLPYSQYESIDPEGLWTWMDDYERKTGGDILAIPHNGNLSNGLMFPSVRMNGEAIDEDYTLRRNRREPLTEVTQIKGDGETHPALSPNDEFADYGTWDRSDLAGFVAKSPSMLQYEYAREALKNGLKYKALTETNPYKFGMIGSSDSHTGLSTTREDNYFGKFLASEPAAKRFEHYVIPSFSGDDNLSTYVSEELASGLAAVWAQDNTRGALFEAMQRKEVYGTTGTRITVRFFGSWNYTIDDLNSYDMALTGYRKGVPMGGDLSKSPAGHSPVFMAIANKDPLGANLDRIQIIKGWLGVDGQTQEKVYNVALSDGRQLDKSGKAPLVGSTVDLKNASYTNDIGEATLKALWTDPDFDPAQQAFYYVRVLEIPMPTWPAYGEKYYGIYDAGFGREVCPGASLYFTYLVHP